MLTEQFAVLTVSVYRCR